MATLIQSKQIQGVVTASVIEGDFEVGGGGSVNLSGASGVTGSFTGSFKGDGSELTFGGTGIVSRSSQLIPTFDGLYLEIKGDGVISSSAQLYSDFDARYGNEGGDGLISSSQQVVLSNVSGYTTFSSSLDSRLDSLIAATSSYLTSQTDNQTLSISGQTLTISSGNSITLPSTEGGGTSDFTQLTNVPSGLVSSSIQITDGSGLVSGSVLRTLDGTGVLSGSVVTSLPNGIISGSTFTDFSSSIDLRIDGISAGGVGADWNLNLQNIPSGLVSGSVLRTLDGTGVVSGSVLRTLDGTGVISGSLTSQLPSGLVSGSTQITDGSNIVSGSVLRSLDGTGVVSGSVLRTLGGTDVVSGSVIRTLDGTNIFSGSLLPGSNITITSGSGNITISSSGGGGSVPAGTISGSAQITAFGFTSGSHTDIPSGTISSSAQVISSLPSGVLSGSSQLPSGLISGSTQITDGSGIVSGSVVTTLDGTGVVSGSVLRTLDGTSVFSGSLVAGTNVTINQDGDNFIISSSTSGGGTSDFTQLTNVPSGLVSGSSQITDASGIVSGSEQISFNGNRVVSQEKLPTMFTSSFNPGTSGSVVDFLNAIFYPNTEPTITTGNQTIEEYTSNGSTIVTITGTDPEGQSLTFGTASSYTDDLVRVASNGVLTLNALAESSSFNTDLVGGVHGHTFTATATDTFNATIEKDITVFVTPNEAPKFREGSTGGNVITSVTSNLNENSTNNTLVKRVFFTDAEGDTITITTSSIDNNHFDVTVYGTYLDIRQNTGSLDYEQQTQYTFSITASDEHFEGGEDSDSRTFLPITINVTDNLSPTINNQTLSSINENSSNGASVGSISATDNEGDSISFVTFDLHKLELDNVNVPSGSYGGTSQLTDPHENPFQMDSSGNVTRKTGVVINSDLINEYQYRVQVRDNFNSTISNVAIVTIPITDDTPATLSDNWSAGPYIKESEESGATIKTTNYGSTQADYNSNQSGTWSSSNSSISINSNGNLSLNVDLSGSVTQSGETIDSTITFTNSFGTTTTDLLSVSVVANDAPTATFTNQTSNLNSNLATENTNLVLVGISDTESDTPYSASLSGTDASKLNLDYQNSNSSSVYIRANEDLSVGTLTYNLKVTDNYDKSTTYSNQTIIISTPDTGTLGGDTTSYIIESGENGESIRDASGFGAGNQSQMSVSYSPNYGSQAVQGSSWTSSNPAISINTSGQLSLGLDISGSSTGSGDDIVSTIGFQDQYGNSGTGTVTVNVFANQAPTATFTDQSANFETDLATTGTTMVSMSISDTESDTPFSASLTGTDASSLQLKYTNSNSSSVGIQASTNLSAATYNYNVKVTDNFGKSREYNSRSFTVDTSADNGKVYLYDVGFSNATYNTAVGITSEDSSTPPIATPYSNIGFVDAVINDDILGDSTFTYPYGSTQTATKLAEASGSNLHDVLRSMGSSGTISRNSSKHFVILFPSGSDMGGIPTTTTDGYGGSTTGEYVLEVGGDGTTIDGTNTIEASEINQITLATSHVGFTKWFMVGASNQFASSTSINLGLSPSSGSGGV